MLGAVSVAPRTIAEFEPVVGRATIEALRRRARLIQGLRVINLSVSAFGTWHTDLLGCSVSLLQDLGLQAEWGVVHPTQRANAALNDLYAALAGAGVHWDIDKRREWLAFIEAARTSLALQADVVVVHDPQLLALAPEPAVQTDGRRAAWIWHSHIDLSSADPDALADLYPYVERYDLAVFEDAQFVPANLPISKVKIIAPGLDPLGPRNVPMDHGTAAMLVERLGIDARRPLLAQISPLGPGSDALGLIEAFDALKQRFHDLQLVIVPTVVRDDEGTRAYFEAVSRLAMERDDCVLVPVAAEVGNAELNALQQVSTVIVQKSLERGYALWLSEAMWKQRPVVAGRATGTLAQIRDGETGFLVPDTQTCIARLGDLLADADLRRTLGENARRHVGERFLITRYLDEVLQTLGNVMAVET